MLIEDHWHNSFDVITELVSLHDTNYKILKVNKAFADAFHLTRDQVIGKQCYEIIHETKEPLYNCPCSHALELKKPVILESYKPLLDSHLEITAYPLFDDKNNFKGMLHFMKNITGRRMPEEPVSHSEKRHQVLFDHFMKNIKERRLAEEALSHSEKRYQVLFDQSPDGILLIDGEGKIVAFNEMAHRQLGYSREEFAKLRLSDIDPVESPDETQARIKQVLMAGKARFEVIQRTKQGELRNVYVIAQIFPSPGRNVFHAIWRDITERKKIEEELRMAHEKLELRVLERTLELNRSNEQLRNLAAHLQSVREEERAKIAREIHDELGQALTAQKMELSWFRDRYGDHKPIFDKSGAMLDALNATMRSVRRICTALRPSILDDFGLVDAMQWQANEFQTRTRIECAVDSVPEHIELDKDQSTALFRIFQETLTNVLKHARATKVTARLTKDNHNITLEVIDNGKGITDEQFSKPQSFGLIGMRERVYPWGGKVEITGHKNRGTRVKVCMPHLTL